MTLAQIAAAKKAIDKVRDFISYIEKDQEVMLGLREPVWIEFTGKHICRKDFYNGLLCISNNYSENKVRLDISAFSALLRIWNGPDLIDNWVLDGRLEASLWHDVIWVYAIEIATAWNCSVEDVLEWANSLFYAAWKYYGELYPESKFVPIKARVAYGIVSFASPWYHKFKKFLVKLGIMSVLVFTLGMCVGASGCSIFGPPPDSQVTGSSGTFEGDNIEVIEPWNISTNAIN